MLKAQFRRATLEDVPFVARLIRELYAPRLECFRIPYDHESTLVMVGDLVSRGIVLVGESSCAGCLIYPFPFNANARVASVYFWYWQKLHGIGILKALMKEAKAAGATHLTAASHFPENRIGRYYRKVGMRAVETAFVKVLD